MVDRYRKGHAQYMLEYWQRKPQKYLWWAAKKRAETTGLEFTISEDDIVIPEYCPILGIKLSQVRSGNRTYAPSLDRKDNTKGYVPGNIFVMSWKANKYKSDMTLADVEALHHYISS
jgi:hypothetical protein